MYFSLLWICIQQSQTILRNSEIIVILPCEDHYVQLVKGPS